MLPTSTCLPPACLHDCRDCHLLIRATIASPRNASTATDVARLARGSPPVVLFLNCLLTRAGTSSF